MKDLIRKLQIAGITIITVEAISDNFESHVANLIVSKNLDFRSFTLAILLEQLTAPHGELRLRMLHTRTTQANVIIMTMSSCNQRRRQP